MKADKSALICDLAETYGIFDYRALPVSLLATLSVGLRDNSRIKMHLAGVKASRAEILAAATVDRLSMLVWLHSEDGRNGTNRPKSVLATLMGQNMENDQVEAFENGEDFEREWERITGVSHGR